MAQSDARFGYTASLSRSDHDLSRPFGFTCAPGMLLPVFADVVSPGDSIYVKHDLPFMRTSPLAAPAMVDVKVHFETFFVPLQMLYQVSENTLTSITEQFSSMFVRANMQNTNFPLFDYDNYILSLKASNFQGTDIRAQAFRLADMLGLNAENFCTWHGNARQPWLYYAPAFFPWQILAYHTIFNYYYRLDDKTQLDPTECNWDQYYSSANPVLPSVNFMRIHQRPWNFDYFTSVYWSPIVSSANLQNVLPYGNYSDLINKRLQGIQSSGVPSTGNANKIAFAPVLSAGYSDSGVMAGLNTAVIRQLFANEKLAMITGRARKNYDSQILAHYGVKVPHDVKHELSLIGQDSYSLRIGEVTSLASTDDAPLGELAGKGWASSRENGNQARQHKFTAPVHGVVMTIFSVEPLRRYFGGFEKQNAVSDAFDLPVPEFDRLGNQPVFRYQVGDTYNSPDQATDLVAWKERYYEWKRRSPKCTLAFASGLRGQGSNNYEAYMLATRPFAGPVQYSVRGSAQASFSYGAPSVESRYYIPFNALDSIMLQRYGYGFAYFVEGEDEDWDNNPWLLYIRDPFIVDCYPTVKKVSWMSKDGEPIYPY